MVYSLLLSTALSCVIGYIEISNSSEQHGRVVFCTNFFIYLFLISLGNAATTLLVPSVMDPATLPTSTPDLTWVWHAGIGVFGFSAVLRNSDVKLFKRGVLSFSEWLEKARDNATASVIKRAVDDEHEASYAIAEKLRKVSEVDMNTHFLSSFDTSYIEEIEALSDGQNTDTHFLKALVLAKEEPSQARAIVQGYDAHADA